MTESREPEAPAAGEQIHMPSSSIIPLVNAVGLALAIVGVTSSTFLVVAGLIIFLVSTVIWIRDTKRDIDALPAEHH